MFIFLFWLGAGIEPAPGGLLGEGQFDSAGEAIAEESRAIIAHAVAVVIFAAVSDAGGFVASSVPVKLN